MRPVFEDHDPLLRKVRDSVRDADQMIRSVHPETIGPRSAAMLRLVALNLAETSRQLLRTVELVNRATAQPARRADDEARVVSAFISGIIIGGAIVYALFL